MLAVFIGFGLALVVAGGVVLNGTMTWTIEARYGVGLGDAPDDLNWTLWVPRPVDPLPVDKTRGAVQSTGAVETEHGTMENLTGHGSGGISFVLRQTVVAVGSVWGHIDLSGSEGRGYWVWRGSDNASKRLFVQGLASWHGEHHEENETTCDANFGGGSTEGWSLIPGMFCEGGYRGGIIPWEALGLLSAFVGALLLVGGAVVWELARSRRRAPGPSPHDGKP